jgi:hypothetical protein
MKMKLPFKAQLAAVAITSSALALVISGCNSSTASTGISPQVMADSLHAVMAADRTVYTKKVVNRLVKEDKVIKASEHWQDEKALPLPAQMFRFGAEMVAEKGAPFSYSLLSLWPINKQNAPKTDVEKEGLNYIKDNPGENFYKEEELGGTKYYTAIYPDPAVAPACVDCHNNHKDTPKSDFQIGDVMGGVVIRIPLS